MSYILDALKKIEQEKNNKKQPDGRINISGDLFRDRPPAHTASGIRKSILLVAVASLVTCAGTWFLLGGKVKKSPIVSSQGALPQPVQVKPLVLPASAPLPTQPQSAPVSVSSQSASEARSSKEVTADDAYSSRVAHGSKKRASTSSSLLGRPSVQTVPVPADIKLSGIAWQEDRIGRRAVINGFLLKEGAMVSGAAVTEIQPDRVRFTSSTGTFEIRLDALMPEGRR